MSKRVLLLVPTPTAFGQDVVAGIVRYSREHAHWRFLHRALFPTTIPRNVSKWKPDGVIVALFEDRLLRAVKKLGIPFVNVGQSLERRRLRTVRADNHAAGELAAEHLLARGFRSLGYYGLEDRPFSFERAAGFRQRAAEAGVQVEELLAKRYRDADAGHEIALASWLKGLRKPAGIYTCLDYLGATAIEVAGEAGLHVPTDVAVVGTDNDSLLCEMVYPPLSSVDIASDRRGYEAAAWLDELMSSRRSKTASATGTRTVPPRGVVARLSSDTVAVPDADVALAVRFIREHAHRPMRVADILRAVPVSRRLLERRFREHLSHLPADEIRSVRLAEARRLLAETDLTLAEIARRTGLRTIKSLSDVFSRHVGQTASEYRRRHQRKS